MAKPEVKTFVVTLAEDQDIPSKLRPLAGEYFWTGEDLHGRPCYAQVHADVYESTPSSESLVSKKSVISTVSRKEPLHLFWDGTSAWWFGYPKTGWRTGIACAEGAPDKVPETNWQLKSSLIGKRPCPALSVAPKVEVLPQVAEEKKKDATPRCGSGCAAGLLRRGGSGSKSGSKNSATNDDAAVVPQSSIASTGSMHAARVRDWAKAQGQGLRESAQAAHEKVTPVVLQKGQDMAVSVSDAAMRAHEKHWPTVRQKTMDFASAASETAKQKATDFQEWAANPETQNFFKGLLDSIFDIITKTVEAACSDPSEKKKDARPSEEGATASASSSGRPAPVPEAAAEERAASEAAEAEARAAPPALPPQPAPEQTLQQFMAGVPRESAAKPFEVAAVAHTTPEVVEAPREAAAQDEVVAPPCEEAAAPQQVPPASEEPAEASQSDGGDSPSSHGYHSARQQPREEAATATSQLTPPPPPPPPAVS
eukprot:TRINITY_DN71747_c0_g1_i1.p1 TRINITY_DN71747_c0_g1~~TRINITY_DN71747_c0_g1_i1.p1  ORF type:complete len:524 (-),score=119.38 TRINITY_DN71747_c0_g1_i1:16-1461(-)